MVDRGQWVAEDELSETTREWLEAQPVQHGPAYVLACYALRSRGDIAEDKAREERRAASRKRYQDMVDAAAFRGEIRRVGIHRASTVV